MNYQVLALELENIFNGKLHRDIGHLADDIHLHPYDEIKKFLYEVQKENPLKEKAFYDYLCNHHGMGNDSIDTLIKDGYDMKQAINDLKKIV